MLTIGELAVLSLDMARVHGAGLLRATLPFVIENLRSPKEADVFLLLCLPARLGGFALPRPLSNYAIDVSWVRDGFFAGWTSCEVDLFWGQARLVVEYDSWDHHDERGQEKLEHDRERADALRAMGFTVVTIRRNDLYSPRLFRAKAEEVANSLGGELPAPMSEFLVANERLRRMLLRHDRWA